MTLAPGSRFGAYEVASLIGRGGMGEVYRATDTQLHRLVALKVLPETFAADSDRIARFEREAQLLASLNHPHIAAIYGLERSGGVQALVLELVEGATLADRLANGALPLDEALPLARQIAEALEAAHESGVIHRDLKPANIKVRDDGTVKVLDFGLAKAIAPDEGPASGPANSPTITAGTRAGVILGTAAYMSPEQAKGKAADRRSDVWAFGCVLFEMLTGRRTFDGEDVSETLASVLRADPAWHALPAATPEAIRRLLRRSLERDRRRRLADIGVARLEIDEALAALALPEGLPAPVAAFIPERPLWKRVVPPIITAMVTGVLAASAAWVFKPSAAPEVMRSRYVLPESQGGAPTARRSAAISPDGTRMAYIAGQSLFVRDLSEFDGRLVAGAQNLPGFVSYPVFSPDGGSIAFFTFTGTGAGSVHKIPTSGGTVETIATVPTTNYGMSWDEDGLLIGAGAQGVSRVSAGGGTPVQVLTVEEGEEAAFPEMLPDRNAVIFTLMRRQSSAREQTAQLVVQPLPSGARRPLMEGADARYLPSGHLVYAVGGTLFAVPFDTRRLEVTGERTAVIDGVRRSALAEVLYGVSNTGTLIYAPGPGGLRPASMRHFVVMDREGRRELLKAPPGAYVTVRISPNGRHLLIGTDDGNEADVWIYDLDGTAPLRRLTFGGRNRFPIWSSDGTHVAFQSDREGDFGLFWQRADTPGSAERLTTADKGVEHVAESWSPLADALLYSVLSNTGATLSFHSITDRKSSPVGNIRSSMMLNAEFSPDGRWIAYTARGVAKIGAAVFVEPFPPTGAKYQVTSDYTTHHPVWSPDGAELSYRVGSGQQVIVPVRQTPSFLFGTPLPLPGEHASTVFGGARNYDITRDGKRFVFAEIFIRGEGLGPLREYYIVKNWFEELKQRLSAR